MEEKNTYERMESLLRRVDCQYTAAEIQGVACGLLVVNLNADEKLWLDHIIENRDPMDVLQNDIAKELKLYLQSVREQMQDSNLEFELLLPEEDDILEDRVEAMQEWSSGFMMGVALAGLTDFSNLPEDTQELFNDFIEISKAGQFSVEEREESEDAYLHIVEYLRMGVLLIAEELQPSSSAVTLH